MCSASPSPEINPSDPKETRGFEEHLVPVHTGELMPMTGRPEGREGAKFRTQDPVPSWILSHLCQFPPLPESPCRRYEEG